MPDQQHEPHPQTPAHGHRAVLTVTVTSRPDGGHYFDQTDFAGHVTEWVRAGLKGKHAVDEVTIVDQAAELARAQAEAHQYRTALQGVARAAVPSVAAPHTPAALRERIAQALYPTYGQEDRNRSLAIADAVLAVLPAPADRAAVLREAADVAREEAHRLETGNHDARAARGARSVAYLLRRLAEAPQPETEEKSGTCTATIPDAFGSAALHRCTAPAGHYDESNEPDFTGDNRGPGGWHTNGQGHVWSDRAASATPHKAQPDTSEA